MKTVLSEGDAMTEAVPTPTAAWSVHAVIASKSVRQLDRPSLGDHVQLVLRGALTAVVSPCPPHLFRTTETSADSPVEAEALAEAAREHERIVESVLACTDVVPLRFGLAVRSFYDVGRLLSEEEARFSSSLHSVAGCVEWSVALRSDPSELESDSLHSGSGVSGPSDRPGRDYLLARKQEREAAAKMAERAPAQLRSIASALASTACRSVRSEGGRGAGPTSPEVGSSVTIGRLACLVERRTTNEFFSELEAALEAVGAGSVRAEVTGPWPAYHFVEGPPDSHEDEAG